MRKRYLISRTDAIGDVVLTLPLAGLLKEMDPGCHITFIGRKYTKPLLEMCTHIDSILEWDESLQSLEGDVIFHVFPKKSLARLAKKSGIKLRIGSSHRWYHWFYCNKRPAFSRARSGLHEALLNLKLAEGIGIDEACSLEKLPQFYGLPFSPPSLSSTKFKLILHPKSAGSAVEWGVDNFSSLINLLPPEKYEVFITGTEEEGVMVRDSLPMNLPHVTDLTGKMTLAELITFIGECDGLVAASTGPLHIAAAMGKKAVGLYSPRRPIHPGRWAPLGFHATSLVWDSDCSTCASGKSCPCIGWIDPKKVVEALVEI